MLVKDTNTFSFHLRLIHIHINKQSNKVTITKESIERVKLISLLVRAEGEKKTKEAKTAWVNSHLNNPKQEIKSRVTDIVKNKAPKVGAQEDVAQQPTTELIRMATQLAEDSDLDIDINTYIDRKRKPDFAFERIELTELIDQFEREPGMRVCLSEEGEDHSAGDARMSDDNSKANPSVKVHGCDDPAGKSSGRVRDKVWRFWQQRKRAQQVEECWTCPLAGSGSADEPVITIIVA